MDNVVSVQLVVSEVSTSYCLFLQQVLCFWIGMSANLNNNDDSTPLMLASENGDLDIVKLLVDSAGRMDRKCMLYR